MTRKHALGAFSSDSSLRVFTAMPNQTGVPSALSAIISLYGEVDCGGDRCGARSAGYVDDIGSRSSARVADDIACLKSGAAAAAKSTAANKDDEEQRKSEHSPPATALRGNPEEQEAG